MFPAGTKLCLIWAMQTHTSIPQTGQEPNFFVIYPIVSNSLIVNMPIPFERPANLPNLPPFPLNKVPNGHAIREISRKFVRVAMPNLPGHWCNHPVQIGAQRRPSAAPPRPVDNFEINVTTQPKPGLVEIVKSAAARPQFFLVAAASCVAFSICDLGILSSNSSLKSTIRFLSFFDLVTWPARIVQRSAST